MSPTARTMDAVRKSGGLIDVAECYNAFSGRRRDLFGFIDLVAIYPGRIIGIQACTTGDQSKRIKKICEDKRDTAAAWLAAGGEIHVWGWKQYKKAVGGRRWRETVSVIGLDSLAPPQ